MACCQTVLCVQSVGQVYNVTVQVPASTTASTIHTTMHGADDDGVLEVSGLLPAMPLKALLVAASCLGRQRDPSWTCISADMFCLCCQLERMQFAICLVHASCIQHLFPECNRV